MILKTPFKPFYPRTDRYYGHHYPVLEKTWGYRTNQHRDYYRKSNRRVVYIIAQEFNQKVLSNAVHNDFGFTVNGTVNKRTWAERGIHFRKTSTPGLQKYLMDHSESSLGSVFIICGRRFHRPAVFINRDKHLVILAPPIRHSQWPHLSIFKLTAEYLNIDVDIFRPE